VDAYLLGQHEMLDDVGNRPFVSTRFEALLLDAQDCNLRQHAASSRPHLGDQGEHFIICGESGIDSLLPVCHLGYPPSHNRAKDLRVLEHSSHFRLVPLIGSNFLLYT
jgi:hypothetical protein